MYEHPSLSVPFCVFDPFPHALTPSILHAGARHGPFDASRCKATLDTALGILLLFIGGVAFAHVGNVGWPVRAVTNGHAYADLAACQ